MHFSIESSTEIHISLTIIKHVQRPILEYRNSFQERLLETIEIRQRWFNQNKQVITIVLTFQNTNLVFSCHFRNIFFFFFFVYNYSVNLSNKDDSFYTIQQQMILFSNLPALSIHTALDSSSSHIDEVGCDVLRNVLLNATHIHFSVRFEFKLIYNCLFLATISMLI